MHVPIAGINILNIYVAWVYCACVTFQITRVKLIIEEIEREEAALREDLYSADRKFAEYYNVCE
jgi:hypothetical protein